MNDTIPHVCWVIIKIIIYSIYLSFNTSYEWIIKKYFTTKEALKNDEFLLRSIIFKHKLEPEEITRSEDFVMGPGRKASISVLKDPNWHLFSIEKDKVLFVRLLAPISEYAVDRYAFMYTAIFEQALAVGELTHEQFLHFSQLLEQDGKPPKTVFYTNTPRSGSTLFAKMLHHPTISQCFGEPHSLAQLAIFTKNKTIERQHLVELVKATVICLRHYVPSNEICVLKTTSGEACLVPLISECLPEVQHVFFYRTAALFPVERMLRRQETMTTIFLHMHRFLPKLARWLSTLITMEEAHLTSLHQYISNLRYMACVVYAAPYSDYERNKQLYCLPAIELSDVLKNGKETLTTVYKTIGIPVNKVEDGLKCLHADSQQDTFLSKDKLAHIKLNKLTDEEFCILTVIRNKLGAEELEILERKHYEFEG